MTAARAIAYNGKFGDTNLPRISLFYTSPMVYALYDWAADGLPLGPLTSWPSLVNDFSLPASGGAPTVVDSGGGRAVRFDGVDDFMRAPFVLSTPHTILAVYRYTAKRLGDAVFYGYNGRSAGSVLSGPVPDNMVATGGGKWMIPSPAWVPDTNWHVAVLSVNGANSVLRIDGKEITGDLGADLSRDGIALGFSDATGNRATIEYKRVTVFPAAAGSGLRNTYVETLANRYNVPR